VGHAYRTTHSRWTTDYSEHIHEQRECSCGSIIVRVATKGLRGMSDQPFTAPAFFVRRTPNYCEELKEEKEHT
jgi:hypothetical protein